jgi:hypothetical protein
LNSFSVSLLLAFTFDANGNALADTLTVDGQSVAASYSFDALDC